MSPLVSAPNRGYADEQRVENYDTLTLWSNPFTPSPGPITSPVLDMSRFAYVGGVMEETQSQCHVAVDFYADALASVFLGVRVFILSSLIGQQAQMRLPSLGPFMAITLTQPSAGNFTCGGWVIGTNRVHPLEFIPTTPVIVDVQGVVLNSGVTVQVYPTDYYAGPSQVFFATGASTFAFSLQWMNLVGVWETVAQYPVAASTDSIIFAVTPPGAWRWNITNTGGANVAYDLVHIPATTGAT